MYICAICGSEFETLDGYVNCVSACGKKAQEEKRVQELNADINKVKSAKQYYEETLEWFKEKHPEEYKLNFGTQQGGCDCEAACEADCFTQTSCEKPQTKIYNEYSKHDENLDQISTIAVSVLENEDGKIEINATLNGEKVDNETLDELLMKPETMYIAKLLRNL